MSDFPISAHVTIPQEPIGHWNRFAKEFEWVSRLIIGGVFIWSGTAHLANPYYFLSTVYQYELTSALVGALVASYLPFLELVLATCLLSGASVRPAWLLTTLLLISFVAVQSSALARGLKISCGCFGPEINRPVDMTSVSFTAGLVVLSIGAILCRRRLDRASPQVAGIAS